MESLAQVFAFAMFVVVITGQSTPTSTSTPDEEKPLSCQRSEGIMANWQDDTCRSYFICDNFNLTVVTCEEEEVFSIMENACVNKSTVACDEQNRAVGLTVEASAILRETSNPGYVLPDPELDDRPRTRVAAMLHTLHAPQSGRSKRQALQTMGIPTPGAAIETINVTLPERVCERIDSETAVIEALMNALLLSEAGCKDLTCGLPLFHLYCDGEDDFVEDAPRNATSAASTNIDGAIPASAAASSTNVGNSTLYGPAHVFGVFETSANTGSDGVSAAQPAPREADGTN
ncbi:unnamed protein product [Lymnaea stagnalis]|uniref:Chitin-binding type-2 domain-containing protein n=1 Tax=Lymnaea stagnalis TaxID=6523 RepID=A0AAV2I4T2_LYMST